MTAAVFVSDHVALSVDIARGTRQDSNVQYSGNRTHGFQLTKLRALHGGRSEVSATCKGIQLASTWYYKCIGCVEQV